MTESEARDLGYRVIKASPFEVGLIKGEQGVRTWFASDFDGKMPTLGHPEVIKAAEIFEEYLAHQ